MNADDYSRFKECQKHVILIHRALTVKMDGSASKQTRYGRIHQNDGDDYGVL
jgi:hypothetical protein